MITVKKVFEGKKVVLALAMGLLYCFNALGQAQAAFTISDNTLFLCNGSTASVQFTNTSTNVPNGATYLWDFGNNSPGSNQTNPTQVYTSANTFTITLNIMLGGSAISTVTNTLTVENPTATFTVNTLTGCEEGTVFEFTNQAITADSFAWAFGDGNSLSNINNPTHVYNDPNPNITVSLLLYVNGFAPNACASAYKTLNILPKPVAVATANPLTACSPNEVITFTNNSQSTATHFWDFGDGITSTLPNPTHIFTTNGNHMVTYIANSSGGCSDTTSLYVYVGNAQIPQITPNPAQACGPILVSLVCPNVTNATYYHWDFGDGSNLATSNSNLILHLYNNTTNAPVSYNVSLTTFFGNGSTCNSSVTLNNLITIYPKPLAAFTPTSTMACPNLPTSFINNSQGATSYLWNFGNSNVSTDQNPTTLYTLGGYYNVSLLATNQYGCKDTMVVDSAIFVPNIMADFQSSVTTGCNVHANFMNFSTGSTAFTWNFGDGSPVSNLANPTHNYNTPGMYTVTLIATNGECTDTLVRTNYINVTYSTPSYSPPIVPFTGCVGLASTFQANNSAGIGFDWDFGDGTTGTGPNPTHVYDSAGTYIVSLITLTADSCHELISNFSTINVYGGQPVVNTVNMSCNAPYTVQLSTPAAGSSYLWEFGDNATSSQQNPTHVYATDGYYNVSLTIVSQGGCLSTYNGINQLGLFPFSAGFGSDCQPAGANFQAQFVPNPSDAASVQWIFGDNQTSNDINANMVFDTANAPISVTAIITNQFGCVDTVSGTVCGDVPPSIPQPAGLNGEPDTSGTDANTFVIHACAPYDIAFNNQFLWADSVVWHFGDGGTSNLFQPSHQYGANGTYTISTDVYYGNNHDLVYQPYILDIGGHVPSILISQQNFCDSIVVLFQGVSPGATSWLWTLDNNYSNNQQSFQYTYTSTNQTYHVQLTTIDAEGCPGSTTSSVYSPIANPAFNYETHLCNQALEITHNVDSTLTYFWNFGDGFTSTDPFPSHHYDSVGTYTITVHITDVIGCPHDYTLDPVGVFKPTASYTSNVVTGCAPLTVNFTSTSTGYTGNNSHYWFFNSNNYLNTNGQTVVSHTFTEPGIYPVKLVVFNVDGINCSDEYYDTIVVQQANVGFTFTQNKICFQPQMNVQFTDTTNNAVSWLWNFGDGTTSTDQNPLHIFTGAPSGPITLTASTSSGCTATSVGDTLVIFNPLFDLASDTLCLYAAGNYHITSPTNTPAYVTWNFGDNSPTTNVAYPSHTFPHGGDFIVTAYLQTQFGGCKDTLELPVHVIAPIAQFNSNSPAACAPSNIIFNNTSQVPPGSTCKWDFGDGSTFINNNSYVFKTYSTPGIYTVKLKVTTPEGCVDSIVYPNYITVLGPVANFILSSGFGCTNDSIDFINLSTNVDHWCWYFGDGTLDSTHFSLNHTYSLPGSYTTTLMVYDSIGCSSILSMGTPLNVYAKPHAEFVLDFPSGCAPYLPAFYNTSTGATSYTWIFGNGDYSNDSIPSYTYQNVGNFITSLIAASQSGCTDTAYASVTVNAPPIAGFNIIIQDSSCQAVTIGFDNTSIADTVADYKWMMNNGWAYSGLTPPSYTFDSSGVYTITLSVINTVSGCIDTVSHSIEINVPGNPIGLISTTDTLACGNLTVNFNFWVQGATSIEVSYGDGPLTTAFNPQHTYSAPGTYIPYVIMHNQFGCVDTIFCNPILVVPVPTAAFSVDAFFSCVAYSPVFSNNTTGLFNPSYAWDFGNGQTSTDSLPTGITYTLAGTYPVTLVVTNQYGCSNTQTSANFITIADTLAPDAIALKRVTVLSESKVKIEWEQSAAFDFGTYDIYRFDGATYVLVARVDDVTQTQYNDDNGLATLTNSYCYKVGVTDLCGHTKGVDAANAHCTINASATLLSNNNRLIKWNPYGGCSVDYYEVYRTTGNAWLDTTQANLIGTVAGDVTGYLDDERVCPREYKYRVKAISLCSGTLYSLSDTATSPMPKLDITTQPADVTRSTVVENQFVRSEWKAPYETALISYYTVYRSADGTSYQSIGQVTGPFSAADTLLSYDDWDASLQSLKYYYKIETTSQCSAKTSTGKTGDNMVVKSNLDASAYEVTLSWTPYLSWGAGGVDHYIIEWQDELGVWHVLDLPEGQYPNNQIPGSSPTTYTAPY